jgi:hypothetical protein
MRGDAFDGRAAVACPVEEISCELVTRTRAFVDEVIDAVASGFDEGGDGIGQIVVVRRVGDFIGDDAQRLACCGCVQDRLDEVFPTVREQPRFARCNARIQVRDGLLAKPLAVTVTLIGLGASYS